MPSAAVRFGAGLGTGGSGRERRVTTADGNVLQVDGALRRLFVPSRRQSSSNGRQPLRCRTRPAHRPGRPRASRHGRLLRGAALSWRAFQWQDSARPALPRPACTWRNSRVPGPVHTFIRSRLSAVAPIFAGCWCSGRRTSTRLGVGRGTGRRPPDRPSSWTSFAAACQSRTSLRRLAAHARRSACVIVLEPTLRRSMARSPICGAAPGAEQRPAACRPRHRWAMRLGERQEPFWATGTPDGIEICHLAETESSLRWSATPSVTCPAARVTRRNQPVTDDFIQPDLRPLPGNGRDLPSFSQLAVG